MKEVKLFLFLFVLILSGSICAQVVVNVNLGSPPKWGPVGYNNVRYYYLPEVAASYDVHTHMFIYYSGGVWLQRSHLPPHLRNYDLYGGYKVVMVDYRDVTPYTTFNHYKVKYKKGYRGPAQKNVGQKNASKQSGKPNI